MAPPLRLALTGGGTGGHVSPALAVVASLRERTDASGRPLELLWLGSHDGVERAAAARAGIPFVAIPTGKLRRYLTLVTLRDMARLPLGLLAAYRQLTRFRPHILFSTGGFVSVPPVMAARLLGVPILTHEQTVTVGLANRLNARVASVVALSFAASAAWLPGHPGGGGQGSGAGEVASRQAPVASGSLTPARSEEERESERRRTSSLVPWERVRVRASPTPASRRAPLIVTGNPVRPEILGGCAERARVVFDLTAEAPVVYVTGGARGSHVLNEAVAGALPRLLVLTQLVHQTGPVEANGDLPRLEALATTLSPEQQARYHPRAFVGAELPDLFAVVDLVVGRAGAGTIAELAALGKPALFIPLTGVSAEEQTRNARLLADAGAAVILPEAELTSDRLVAEIAALLANPARLTQMGTAARQFARPDAAERLVDVLLALADRAYSSSSPPSGSSK